MSGEKAYSKSGALAQQIEKVDSHWDLEFQDALLDVAAVVAGTEIPPSVAPIKPAAARLALTLHWTSRETVQRKN
jgi:hypothetical protein